MPRSRRPWKSRYIEKVVGYEADGTPILRGTTERSNDTERRPTSRAYRNLKSAQTVQSKLLSDFRAGKLVLTVDGRRVTDMAFGPIQAWENGGRWEAQPPGWRCEVNLTTTGALNADELAPLPNRLVVTDADLVSSLLPWDEGDAEDAEIVDDHLNAHERAGDVAEAVAEVAVAEAAPADVAAEPAAPIYLAFLMRRGSGAKAAAVYDYLRGASGVLAASQKLTKGQNAAMSRVMKSLFGSRSYYFARCERFGWAEAITMRMNEAETVVAFQPPAAARPPKGCSTEQAVEFWRAEFLNHMTTYRSGA